jgi:hypothetical protein
MQKVDFSKEKILNWLENQNRQEPYTITGIGWGDAIEEARGYGISIKSFSSTADKIVIHPGNMYQLSPFPKYNFNYFWGDEQSWSSESCWGKENNETIIKANKSLLKLGKFMRDNFEWKVNCLSIRGNGKGYLSSYLADLDDIGDDEYENDIVLFIWKLSWGLVEH